jgi:hypothetical protein
MRSWKLSRRAFLGGAGVAVGLPVLEAMLPDILRKAEGQDAPPPVRFLAYYVPNGFHMPDWTPSQVGENYTLPTILSPLADVQEDILVLTGIQNDPARPDGPGDHASGTGAFLTAAHPFKTEGANISNGISVDQVAAGVLGQYTRRPSLQLGLAGGDSVGDCDSGYSCAYARNISWSGPQTPLAKMTQPREVFDLVFAGLDPGENLREAEKRRRYRSSVLDVVIGDVNRLSPRLGVTDRRKLDEYLTAIRQLELQIEGTEGGPICDPGTSPGDHDGDVRVHLQQMTDLMVLAMQCDVTRVMSFMLDNAGGYRVYDFLDVNGTAISRGHHDISHHMDAQDAFDQLTVIGRWEVEQLAYMLERMKAISEPTEANPNATLLDNSVVFFSSEIEDGNSHSHYNMPVVLAGRAGGAIRPGRHVVYDNEPPMADLFISLLDAVGAPVQTFGRDGTGPIGQLA